MMPVIVLSGEPRQLDRLQHECELPPSWFGEDLPVAFATPNSHPQLVRMREAASAHGSATSLDTIDLTQEFIRLAGRLVVEVLVVNRDTDPQQEADRFHSLVTGMKQFMLERDLQVSFVAIVVDEGTGKCAPVLQRVNELRQSRTVDAVYAMTSVLEPRERFAPAARDVWPIAVGRLLFHLMHCPPPKPSGTAPCFAWRMMSLPPQFEQSLEQSTERLVHSLMESIYDLVFKQPVEPKPSSPQDVSDNSSSLHGEIPIPSHHATYWTQLDVADAFQKRLNENRWHPVAIQLASQVIALQHSANLMVRQRLDRYRREQWDSVHENPSMVHRLALRRNVGTSPNSTIGEDERTASAKMIQAKAARDQAIADAAHCAIEFELAQQGRVGTVYRIWPCVAVAMAVGYPAMALTYGLLGSVVTTVLSGLATISATVFAAWYSMAAENRAGIRGRQELERMLDAVDRSIQQFYVASAKQLCDGSTIFAKHQADLLDAHLRESATRAQAVVSLSHQGPRESESESNPEVLAKRNHPDAVHFRNELSLPLPFDLNVSADRSSWWQEFAKEQSLRFKQQVWLATLQRTDPYLTGNLLYRTLSTRWNAFRQTLTALVVTRLCRQQYQVAPSDAISSWGAELNRLQQLEREVGLLSCHIPSAAVNHQQINPAATLVLQNGFEAIGETPTLPLTDLVHFDSPLEILEQLPWLGYWFQEIPVALTLNDDRLVVSNFETQNPIAGEAP
jgi:hypothetical protein